MKFMLMMIPKVYQPGTPASEKAGDNFAPPADAVAKMMKYNEELARAGALVSLDGLHPASKGARIAFSGRKSTVTDGPYMESKEVVGGYWILQFKNKEEAIDWAKRCPAADGDVLELRQIFDMSEYPEEVQKLADNPTVKAQIEKH